MVVKREMRSVSDREKGDKIIFLERVEIFENDKQKILDETSMKMKDLVTKM